MHALIFTAVVSRHMFVWLTSSQTLTAVITGCEAAWGFFGGAFRVLIPDNLKPVVTDADPVNPTLTKGWLDYAQHVGLVRRYDPDPVNTACGRSLDLDVVSVSKIAAMLAKATEHTQPVLPAAAGSPGGRFARDPSEYNA